MRLWPSQLEFDGLFMIWKKPKLIVNILVLNNIVINHLLNIKLNEIEFSSCKLKIKDFNNGYPK